MLSLDTSRVSFKCVEQYVQTEFQHLHVTKLPLLSIISTQSAKIDSAALPDRRAGVLIPFGGKKLPFLCYVCMCLLHVAEIMQDQMSHKTCSQEKIDIPLKATGRLGICLFILPLRLRT